MSPQTRIAALLALGLVAAGCEPALAASHPRPPDAGAPGPPASFSLHVLDVGTGLAILVQGADFNLLYDGGSNDDRKTGQSNRLVAYLALLLGPSTEAGCHPPGSPPASELPGRIDHLFVSHPHRDHLELLPDVLRCYEVADVWESGLPPGTESYARLRAAVDQEGDARQHHARDADSGLRPDATIALGRQAQAVVLSADDGARDANDASIVIRLDLGVTRVLFTGDATAGERRDPDAAPDRGSVEETLLRDRPEQLAANVMIVGHHGSKTSTRRSFLRAVQPRIAIVSSGPMPYGRVVLPDPEIVAMLEASGARVLRTDVDDDGCRRAAHKVGPDADGAPGGCSAYTLAIEGGDIDVNPGPTAD